MTNENNASGNRYVGGGRRDCASRNTNPNGAVRPFKPFVALVSGNPMAGINPPRSAFKSDREQGDFIEGRYDLPGARQRPHKAYVLPDGLDKDYKN